ncbi:Dihydrolipoamide acyltransferase component of branched-chain alpha-keto acid dehydrogenase complex [Serinicoccus hydrothermalis]|uniref:Dihydrolipoamide acetyltransferase component of pyruvate dehydrogenase complex n=1 Tax=Serinicoccus hydrothermalis TaxID=1758689 RepID=A0A1B1NEB7_9MICO|nr:dihydrolipoamide acetyltransferase family protein [Serinicoccus hydrothermalis]ANS79760.1 Dihydrolipoamide acyltransferase component of branched-chain alpha-keto acid dehydrogenase complex [Serinicoccus hydrothermalis]
MTQVFRLPDLGEGLTEAEIVEWHVAAGDEVVVDQEVVTVETAKAAVSVPCPYAGTVAQVHAEAGQVLPVGEPLITIGGDVVAGPGVAVTDGTAGAGGEQYREEERAGAELPEDEPERPLIGYGAGEEPARRSRPGGRRRRATASARPDTPSVRAGSDTPVAVRVISPLVRRLAADEGVDVADVPPGPTGVVRKADLTAYLASAGDRTPDVSRQKGRTEGLSGREEGRSAGGEERRIPIQGVQRLMVERLSTSRREIPDATTWVDVDATRLMKAKDALKAARPDAGIGVLPLLARITVAGLRAYPALNSSVDTEAGEIVHHGAVNLGFAAQSPRGLVVPVVHGADAMTTTELAAVLRELTVRARDGKLSPAELTGGTFTLNNYGVFGVDGSTPIINHPEAAMLGVGRIVDKPWAHRGKVKLRKVTQLSFTFDHRVCDGGTAGGFLRLVADCVEQPAALLADL